MGLDSMTGSLPHRFDADEHSYTALDTGEELPHVTGMLEYCGYTDSTFYTDDGRERGTAVHHLTANYDLGALDLTACVSRYRPYLLGHALAMSILKPELLAVEESLVHPVYRYGCRPDRVWRLAGVLAVCDEKSGEPDKAHMIQTALQAICVSVEHDNIPPHMIERYALYLSPKGKFKLEQHKDRKDFDRAQEVIRRCCKF